MEVLVIFLLLLRNALGHSIISERTDIRCANGACYNVVYELYQDSSGYRMNVVTKSDCPPINCNNCVYKGDWTLIASSGAYYLTRNTFLCLADSFRNFTEIFPDPSSSNMVDIACNSYQCTRYHYIIKEPFLYTYNLGKCSDFSCEGCNMCNYWQLNKTQSYTFLQRQTSSCQALTRIRMEDFFPPSGTPQVYQQHDFISSEILYKSSWNTPRILALIISSIMIIILFIILITFWCRNL